MDSKFAVMLKNERSANVRR